MTETTALCRAEDIPLDAIRQEFLPDGTLIALYNVGGRIYATADACTHAGASLSEDGLLKGRRVECGWHYGSFDVTTGEPGDSPCTIPIKTYPVRVVDGMVYIEY